MIEEDKELELAAHRLLVHAQKTEESVRRSLSYVDEFKSITFRQKSRVKRPEDIAAKVIRKRKEGRLEYSINDVTDICGFRIVTTFQTGIFEALELLLNLAAGNASVRSPFHIKNDERIEVIVYSSRPQNDPLSVAAGVEKVIKKFMGEGDDDRVLNVFSSTEPKQSGYSSVHVTLKGISEDKPEGVWVEFQIRSAFEEVWGEIDHKLRYGVLRGKTNDGAWSKHLNALKTLVDGCIQYVDVIKSQAEEAIAPAGANEAEQKPAEETNLILRDLENLPNEFYVGINRAYHFRDLADQGKSTPDSDSRYKKAAAAFADLLSNNYENLKKNSSYSDELKNRTHYILRMERAYCLLFTNDKNDLKIAEQIYLEIIDENENDAVSRYRYAQILRRTGDLDRAIDEYKKVIELFETGADKRINERHWLKAMAYRNVGYTHWLKAEDLNANSAEANEYCIQLGEAIDWTVKALNAPQTDSQKMETYNNLAYYGWEEREFPQCTGNLRLSDLAFEQYVDTLIGLVDIPTNKRTDWLDTICRCASLLQKDTVAYDAAKRLDEVFTDKLLQFSHFPADKNRCDVGWKWLRQQAIHHLDGSEIDSWFNAKEILDKRNN